MNRATGQLITWTGGDANSTVVIEGFSTTASGSTSIGSGFYCTAKSSDQQFTIPSVVLLSLPQTGPGGILAGQFGFLGVGAGTLAKQFTATGLDIGIVTDSTLSLQTVSYQ